MMDEDLRYEVCDRIAEISLARPPVNALSLSLLEQLVAAFRRAAADDNVRAVVLTSALPRRFSAGLDLGMLVGKSETEVRRLLDKLYVELADVQCNLGKPSIAAIGGSARGGGMTLAISCDVLLAGASATFGYPEIDLGLVPAIHFVHLPKIVGRHRAFELLFSGRTFGAEEALSLGLVSRIVPDERVREEARAMGVFLRRSREQPCGWDALLSCVSTTSITGAALARRWRISATSPRPPTLRKECGRSSKSDRRLGSRRQMAVLACTRVHLKRRCRRCQPKIAAVRSRNFCYRRQAHQREEVP